ncbi:prepilin-type N-terminal cleavage/methylation domain-containing protein [Deefgea tanakiae]|uniref:Prepilin-type N-terminal cleavage/methylation domain-containing protein n=1 Tax=Deefgea tanakiae TaxID=2865840 RepID=A0ABX8Z6V9_9NEIS|nr:prepilin-type N-terminal cleavage/methylation domain-containing protein [Deefgea tanakiae]QZA78324.1 prepilin-type N-terminal cleavage/methylation domain-containing protein [Deefgea tanakiae]
MKLQRGFTLVELAIVLVIIGLILGAAFKGKDLIDGAKVKNMSAQVNKMQAGFNTYFDKYGAYPGDACTTAESTSTTVTKCAATTGRDGSLKGSDEPVAALQVLKNTNILTDADIKSVFGDAWSITDATSAISAARLVAGTNYMVVGVPAATTKVDVRFVCALDAAIDDGNPDAGIVRSSATKGAAPTADNYQKDTDCWAATGTATLAVRVLP